MYFSRIRSGFYHIGGGLSEVVLEEAAIRPHILEGIRATLVDVHKLFRDFESQGLELSNDTLRPSLTRARPARVDFESIAGARRRHT
jgi:hypothetical protein